MRANVRFPKFDVSRTNAVGAGPTRGLSLFTVSDIVSAAGWTYDDIIDKGAVILGTVTYTCDLDKDVELCQPLFTFTRIDPTTKASFSSGFNYRYYEENTATGVRDLYESIFLMRSADFISIFLCACFCGQSPQVQSVWPAYYFSIKRSSGQI